MKPSKRAAFACAAVLLAVMVPLAVPGPAAASEPPHVLIFGGREASSPSGVVALYNFTNFQCTASLIAPRWVLTARHCVEVEGPQWSIRAGNLRRADGTPAKVERVVIHPGADIALLHLDHEVGAEIATLADQDPPIGSVNDIYGWGMFDTEGNLSDVLKTARLTVVAYNTDAYDGPSIESKALTGRAGGGDSGGPQMYQGKVVGVCSMADPFDINWYASVAANRNWIRETSGV